MCVYVYMCVCECVCICPSVCLSISLRACACTFMCVCVYGSCLHTQHSKSSSCWQQELNFQQKHIAVLRCTALHCVVLSRLSLSRVNAATRLELPAETHLSPTRHNEQERTISGTYFLNPTPYTSNVTPKHEIPNLDPNFLTKL